jgi:hydroxyethylthiazole kinase-like sugar kinase family protein
VSNDWVLHSGCLLSAAVFASVTASLSIEMKRTAAFMLKTAAQKGMKKFLSAAVFSLL